MSDPPIDLDAIEGVLRKSGARFAFLHGSRVAGTARAGSDLDVAAYWGETPPASWEVDLPPGVDLLVLDTAPLELRGRVAVRGKLLFDDVPDERVAWQAERARSTSTRSRGSAGWTASSSKGAGVVDERRVRRLLQRIADNVAFLSAQTSGRPDTVRADEVLLSAVKYRFVTAIEGCIDVAQHLCASEGWGPPSDNADALRILGRRGVLATALSESMARAVGFRNVLVQEYAEVEDDRVIAHLDRLTDLEDFVAAVARLLEDS